MAATTIVLYGETDTGKTTSVGFLARMLFAKTKKPLRLISADTGGGWKSIQKYIDVGIIQALSIRNEKSPVFLMHKLVEGYWPLEIDKNGIRASSKMTKDLSNISGYAWEGLTSLSDLFMAHLSGKKLGQDSAYKLELDSLGNEAIGSGDKFDRTSLTNEKLVDEKGIPLSKEIIGVAAQSHYGFIQNIVPLLMEKTYDLPVEVVLWTAHQAQAEDAISRNIVRGPALAGKKGTPKIGRKVGALIHAENVGDIKQVSVGSGGPGQKPKDHESREIRYYFISHPDRENSKMVWPAKPRLDVEQIPELMKLFPGGYFIPSTKPGTGLDYYLEIEEKLMGKGVEELERWKQEILGETGKLESKETTGLATKPPIK